MKITLATLKYSFLFSLILILMSCGTAQKKSDSSTPSLVGTFWILQTLEGKTISHPDDPRLIGFELQESENRIVGFGGCNNFFGTYNLSQPDKISFSPIGATKMACLTTTFNENDFFAVFEGVNNYQIRDQILTLYQDNEVLATLKADKTIGK